MLVGHGVMYLKLHEGNSFVSFFLNLQFPLYFIHQLLKLRFLSGFALSLNLCCLDPFPICKSLEMVLLFCHTFLLEIYGISDE